MGKIYLVGAGLGGVETLTVRALAILRQAEVVLLDDLVDRQLLAHIPAQAEVIGVGKRGGQPSIAQAEINQLMIDRCRAGQQVVRLKSGDPLVFGRALEEINALQAAQCPFEIVPGISSALGGPLWAGIPLTDKDLSGCFAVLTAHDLDRQPWSALAQLDTLVVLMGIQQVPAIAERLMQAGRSAATPLTIITAAARPQQQVCIGSLADLPHPDTSTDPGIVVVGEVVQLRSQFLPWGGGDHLPPLLPLAGKTILVTRAESQASSLTDLLRAAGARVLEMPTLEIVPPSSWQPLDQAIAQLDQFRWLILTSANAVTAFFQRLALQQRDSRALQGMQVAVVGAKTAQTLQQYGIRPDLMPEEFVADALLESFPDPDSLRGAGVLFPRVESGGREILVKGLRDLGAEVAEVAAYQSACPTQMDAAVLQALTLGQVDVLTFASSKTVQHFCQLCRQAHFDLGKLQSTCLAAIGPKTAETCRREFGRVDVIPESYTLADLVQALITFLTS
jgi:uroporphyrinogen III methyltransferase/synthase